MSSEQQQYSLENQTQAIDKYAKQHGFEIVRTYSDVGSSGVHLKHRPEFVHLLHDVVSGEAIFRAVLVYDVSRWGRFQDSDEAAHYEFICKSADIPVHYCAEGFRNDNTISSAVFKTLKRTMAAEYSREMGAKVFAGAKRLAELGFKRRTPRLRFTSVDGFGRWPAQENAVEGRNQESSDRQGDSRPGLRGGD